jgi:hypothetical protein
MNLSAGLPFCDSLFTMRIDVRQWVLRAFTEI